MTISDRRAQQRLRFAVEVTTRLPETLAELKQGRLDEFKAQLICDAVRMLTDEQARAVEAMVVDKAARQTPRQLKRSLAKAVLAVLSTWPVELVPTTKSPPTTGKPL